MNPSNPSDSFRTQESFACPSNQQLATLEHMIESPKKCSVFNPNELMCMDLIKTPLDTEHPRQCNASVVPTSLQGHSPMIRSIAKSNEEVPKPIGYISSSLYSPIQSIASDVAITMTPHPFKKTKHNYSPPSEVTAKYDAPLSDITSRSERRSIVFGRNILGVKVATPRIVLFPDGSRTIPSPNAIFSLSKKNCSNIDDNERFLSAMKENHNPPIEKIFLKTIDESDTPTRRTYIVEEFGGTMSNKKDSATVKKCIKKDSEFTGIKSSHFLSVDFS